jgi:hypothetical protein
MKEITTLVLLMTINEKIYSLDLMDAQGFDVYLLMMNRTTPTHPLVQLQLHALTHLKKELQQELMKMDA